MKISIFPFSKLGKWAVWLVIGAFATFLLLSLLGERVNILPDWLIFAAGPLTVAASLAGGVTALLAILRKDRAVLIFIALLVGVIGLLRLILSAATSLR